MWLFSHFCSELNNLGFAQGESLNLSLLLTVSTESAADLTMGRDTLEDILIFRLENGRDYFITISGDYLKSCFGNSVDFLITVHSQYNVLCLLT